MSVTRTGQSRPNVGAAPGRSAIGGRLAGSLALRRPFAAGTVDYKARKAPYVAAKAVGSFDQGVKDLSEVVEELTESLQSTVQTVRR